MTGILDQLNVPPMPGQRLPSLLGIVEGKGGSTLELHEQIGDAGFSQPRFLRCTSKQHRFALDEFRFESHQRRQNLTDSSASCAPAVRPWLPESNTALFSILVTGNPKVSGQATGEVLHALTDNLPWQ